MITDYDSLKASIRDYLIGHLISDDVASTFVTLAEAEFNRRARFRNMQARSVATVLGSYTTLPTDYLKVTNVTKLGDNSYSLPVLTYDAADRLSQELKGSQPYGYTITGNEIQIIPEPNASFDIEIVYYRKLPALTVSNPTNWLLEKAPDWYLNASLVQAAAYIVDPNRGAFWRAEADRIFFELEMDSEKSILGSSPLIARTSKSY